MKDRHGNEFKSVPTDGHWDMTQAALASLKSKNCGDLTVGDLAAAISNAIAAAPKFEAPEEVAPTRLNGGDHVEVTQEMCERVAASFFGVATFANGVEMHEALQLWRSELGPALGPSDPARIAELEAALAERDTEIVRLAETLGEARDCVLDCHNAEVMSRHSRAERAHYYAGLVAHIDAVLARAGNGGEG